MPALIVAQEATDFVLKSYERHVDDPKANAHGVRKPLIVFISGPQGSGKTFSSKGVKRLLQNAKPELKVVVVSIDDFYLTHEDQQAIAKSFPDNAMLQGRGLPGTHDMVLLQDFMHQLRENAGSTHVPAYDKSRFGGEGDRVDLSQEVNLPVDIVIMEGWFLGFESVPTEKLAVMRNDAFSRRGQILQAHPLEDYAGINASLKKYADLLWDNANICSVGVVIAADVENIYTWRQEQETELIEKTGQGMSNEQVRAFILRYMPCYEIFYTTLKASGQLGNRGTLVVSIDKQRAVVGIEQR
ncbi:LAME_0C01420g1_1 [Lachancea meyersii CBS 8951]|uniref:LAME_0C01420g1_1 n=1 Tax=Lachancea meyersii CBS 8951 TaxID=1266667 RepID=A0A1G4IZ80_9SACH|nr:LAME_0C01420g1_1 [Lachancea meyersii CBS 8951]